MIFHKKELVREKKRISENTGARLFLIIGIFFQLCSSGSKSVSMISDGV